MKPTVPREAPRLAAIEGLRAYLALWVLLCHAMQWSGLPEDGLTGLWAWARQGVIAVKIFMIISGFVILHRLEQKRERTGEFLLHRFFRLFPLYLVMFLVSLPLSLPGLWNGLPAADQIGRLEPTYSQWLGPAAANVALHLGLLQGVPPEPLMPASSYAFLPPAWSIAVEFQFYLLAPAIFWLAVQGGARARHWMYVLGLGLLIVANKSLYVVLGPLTLPFFWPYFLIGIISYYAYRRWRGEIGWPLLAGAGLVIFKISAESPGLFPVCAWLVFLGLLIDRPGFRFAGIVLAVFEHRAVQYLGRISYSIYLSHWPVLVVAHLALAHLGLHPGDRGHLALLLLLTVPVTIGLSAALYHGVENPGVALGRKVAGRIFPERSYPPSLAKAYS